jgi:hypothetical protein
LLRKVNGFFYLDQSWGVPWERLAAAIGIRIGIGIGIELADPVFAKLLADLAATLPSGSNAPDTVKVFVLRPELGSIIFFEILAQRINQCVTDGQMVDALRPISEHGPRCGEYLHGLVAGSL